MNLYLKKKLHLPEDKPAKQKVQVVDGWDRYFQQVQTAHIRDFLQTKGVLRPKKRPQLKDVNECLTKTLKLDEKTFVKSFDEVFEV